MPADPTHNPTVRRANRKREDDIDARRTRGEISCAECRRLKLKCDRQLPCSSCIRRRCSSLCPNGTLATGQGTRSTLVDSDQRDSGITEMAQRIRQLENALAASHSTFSNQVHPLLKGEHLSVKYDSANGIVPAEPKEAVEQVIDALGTMSIGERGEGKYFGRSAGTEMLVLADAGIEDTGDAPTRALPPELASVAATFPFSPGVDKIPWDVLFNHLPPEPRAWTLCETYMEHAAWKTNPVQRDQLVDEILTPIYKAVKEQKSTGIYDTARLSAHQFAVLYLVFALGALLDLTLDPFNNEAAIYFNLGRGALALRSVFDSQEIICVQSILLMSLYKTLGNRRFTMDSSWYLASIAAKLAQGLGLHRDSSRFRMDAKTVQRRRHLFWELFSVDLFSSLWLGRPPTMRLSDTDCEFPDDVEAVVDEHGNTLMGFTRWKHEFTKEIFALVAERTLTAEAPSYQTILELDRKLREKVLPPHLNTFLDPGDEGFSPSKYMKRCLLGQFRSITLLYLHRSFCVRAMLEHPKNPLQSPFAPSYLAAYRCASGIVMGAVNHIERLPELCRRLWTIWTGVFSAAIILGAIIIRSPASAMASSALVELGLACDLFEKGVTNGILQSEKGRAALAILHNMRAKALQFYSNVQSGRKEATYPSEIGKLDEDFDEIALFGGQTRILCLTYSTRGKEKLQQPTPPSSQSSPGMVESTVLRSLPADFSLANETSEVHPALVDYISVFSPPDITSLVPQDLNNFEPMPTFSPEQPVPQNDLTWANFFALSTNESFGNINSHASIFAKTDDPRTSAVVDSGTGQFGDDEVLGRLWSFTDGSPWKP